jgi:phosphatidylinositol 4-kinase
MLVSEIANVILAGTLLPATSVDQTPFARPSCLADVTDTVQADHIRRLLAESLGAGEQHRLGLTGQGETGLKALEQEATRWLADIMEPMVDDRAADRRDSLFTLGGAAADEEVELTVTVLVSSIRHAKTQAHRQHLLNMLSLHRMEPEETHLTRLRLLLSEESTAYDPRVLEAAFVCTSILVRK